MCPELFLQPDALNRQLRFMDQFMGFITIRTSLGLNANGVVDVKLAPLLILPVILVTI